MKVFISRNIAAAGLELLKKEGIEVEIWDQKNEMTPDELIQKCKEAQGVIGAGYNRFNEAFLQSCAHLKVVALHSVGYDNVDIQAATQLNIAVGNSPNVISEATADIAFLLMLAVSRKAFSEHKRILAGDWNFFEPTKHLGIEIKGKTLGIFGLGEIGFEMASRCKGAYNMDIIYTNRNTNPLAEKILGAQKVSFEELLQKSDVLSVHSTLNPQTREKFNAEAFLKMKRTAIFINTARGGIHNETDLIDALNEQIIWGAGLDVTNPEPMDKNNPLLFMENVAVLPHMGSATIETRNAIAEKAAQNVIAAFKGQKIPFPVNPEIYAGK